MYREIISSANINVQKLKLFSKADIYLKLGISSEGS